MGRRVSGLDNRTLMAQFNWSKQVRFLKNYIPILLCAGYWFMSCAEQTDPLLTGFQNPPPSAKARTWWHWMNGNISKVGITADLEAMKEVGIQEAQIFNVKLHEPKGPVDYLSESWLDHFKFAAQEAHRLGMKLGFHNSPGWSSSGGPWVTPENAMQTVVFSELTLTGGKTVEIILPKPKTKLDYYRDIAVFAFPKPLSDQRIDNLDYKSLSGRVRNHLLPDQKVIPDEAIIEKSSIINLTSSLSENDILNWDAPKGEWVILRMGHTPTGHKNRPAPTEGLGLECNKMSKAAVNHYWKNGLQPILDHLGDLVGSVVNNCIIDSYEVGTTNWTAGFGMEFEKLRGYDLIDYLPTLAGYYVESGEVSERFLWDFRRTIGDLMAENYYNHFGKLCLDAGMTFSVEPYWGPFDNMQVGATGDIVMCEFWSGHLAFFDSPKFVASIAKLNGSSIVGAEAFTGIGGWTEHPTRIKAIGDKAWAQGINRFIFHSYVHQPWDVAPGLTLSYHGYDFNRHNTWWKPGKAHLDYIARSQFLLQQGRTVADVLVFTGESSPSNALLIPQIKAMGFDYDLIGVNKLHTLSVKDGQIYTENGDSYRLFVLSETKWMRPETFKILAKLANQGATILGPQPEKSPSLLNYPESDVEVSSLANNLWSAGKMQDVSVLKFLDDDDTPADFSTEKNTTGIISFVHRKSDDTDIYFLTSADKSKRTAQCTFRIEDKKPELWNPQTGEVTSAAVWKENPNGTISLPVTFDLEGSLFVVFREPSNTENQIISAIPDLKKPDPLPLPNLEIVKAEYGSFLPLGLEDITDKVRVEVNGNVLDIQATRHFCDCDPAPGYIKELRIEYLIGNEPHYVQASERERVFIDASGMNKLTIQKAVFGKFKRGVRQVPEYYPTFDVTGKIQEFLDLGKHQVEVSDALSPKDQVLGSRKELKISYLTNGVLQQRTVSEGDLLRLDRDTPGAYLISDVGETKWVTPYPGTLTYETSNGKIETIIVSEVPDPINFQKSWQVSFPLDNDSKTLAYEKLVSWHLSSNEEIRYFSGTATYQNEFEVSSELIAEGNPLELDLGHVEVIAEVMVNGVEVATLWKKPFRINIKGFVKEGTNTLEVKVTNLLPNRLIGDEQLLLDHERKKEYIKEWPDWLLNNTPRPTERKTLSGWQHYDKDSELLVSGLLGPVVIRPYVELGLADN